MVEQTTYGIGMTVELPYEKAVERIRTELSKEGFGILTEIDVRATLRKKIGVNFKPYIILGACNPTLAYQALTEEPDIGLLLPCNVIVYAAEDPQKSVIVAIDPIEALDLTGNIRIRPIAEDARQRLVRALDAVSERSDTRAYTPGG